jgi:hypothetical protein
VLVGSAEPELVKNVEADDSELGVSVDTDADADVGAGDVVGRVVGASKEVG